MSKKNFSVQLKEKGLLGNAAAIGNYLRGKKVQITSSTNGHNYGQIGSIITLDGPVYINGSTSGGSLTSGISRGNTLRFSQFTVLEACSKEEIKEEIAEYEKEIISIQNKIEECNSKIRFMKENKLEKFDEEEFKCYRAFELLDKDELSKMEKAKILAEIIKS